VYGKGGSNMKLNTLPHERSTESRTVTLRVKVDDEGVRPASESFHATESFDVVVSNDGSPKHVNLAVTGEAEPYTSVEVNNVYVGEEGVESVEVIVGPTPGEVEGVLTLSSDYGADTADVELTVGDEEQEAPEGVEVDESLSQPMKPEAAEDDEIPRVDIAVAVVLGLAIFLSILYGLLFDPGTAMIMIAIAILGGGMVWTIKRTAEGPKPED